MSMASDAVDELDLDDDPVATKYRLSDYFTELLGLRKVTKDPEYEAALKSLRAHRANQRALTNAVSARALKFEALVKGEAKVRSTAMTAFSRADDSGLLVQWDETASAAAVEMATKSASLLASLKVYSTQLKELTAKCTKARDSHRSDGDHYAHKVDSLKIEVINAESDDHRRKQRAAEETAKAKKAARPIPSSFHSWYEDTDPQAATKLAKLHLKKTRNATKAQESSDSYDRANSFAIAVLNTAVMDSVAETKPLILELLLLEQSYIAAATTPLGALTTAEAAVDALETPKGSLPDRVNHIKHSLNYNEADNHPPEDDDDDDN